MKKGIQMDYKTYYQRKQCDGSQLEHSVVNDKPIKGLWDHFIWTCWGERTYSRNSNDPSATIFAFLYFLTIVLTIALLKHSTMISLRENFPISLIAFLFISWGNILAASSVIERANQSIFIIIIPLLVGILGVVNHGDFWLYCLRYPLNQYITLTFIASGVMACYCRAWNYLVWKAIDHVVLNYYINNGLDLTPTRQLVGRK